MTICWKIIIFLIACIFTIRIVNGNVKIKPLSNDCKSFTESSTMNPKRLVKLYWFYTDWCSHCKAFESEWNKFVKKMQLLHLENLEIVTINGDHDITASDSLQKKFKINGYPTVLFYFLDGTHMMYDGARNSDSLYERTIQLLK